MSKMFVEWTAANTGQLPVILISYLNCRYLMKTARIIVLFFVFFVFLSGAVSEEKIPCAASSGFGDIDT